jgi:catechol 2,3-dioxygenase-like lactoylglutathione lyase family enzyme
MGSATHQEGDMPGPESAARITNIGTIGILVSDQDRAIEFYVGTLGFEKRLDVRYGESERWVDVAPPGAATTIALVRTSEGGKVGIDTQIRLMTGDAAAVHASLLGLGVDVDAELIRSPVLMFSFRDPDGNRLVIVEQPRG